MVCLLLPFFSFACTFFSFPFGLKSICREWEERLAGNGHEAMRTKHMKWTGKVGKGRNAAEGRSRKKDGCLNGRRTAIIMKEGGQYVFG
jgi:hypothetical protein